MMAVLSDDGGGGSGDVGEGGGGVCVWVSVCVSVGECDWVVPIQENLVMKSAKYTKRLATLARPADSY